MQTFLTSAVDSQLLERLVALRRDLHRHPELGWQERRTAGKVCEFLDELGIAYRNDVAKTGVVAEIPGRSDGPCVALRADMDALPIVEETGLPFASETPGVMHACGHDGHTTMLLGAAALLAREDELPSTVRLVFQPAEETGQGDASGTMHLIFKGEVELTIREPAGSVGTVTAGQCLGETSLLHPSASAPNRSVTAMARTPVETAAFFHADVIELIRRRPDIGVTIYRNLAAGLSSKLQDADRRLV